MFHRFWGMLDMNKILVGCSALLAIWAMCVVLAIFLIKWFWGWTIPELFPKACEQGLVASTISWWTAFKLAILVGFFMGGTRSTFKT